MTTTNVSYVSASVQLQQPKDARPIWTTPNPNRIRFGVLLNREFIALRGVDAERNVDPRAETMPAVEWTNSRQ